MIVSVSTLTRLALAGVLFLASGCSHVETARSMGSREIAAGLLKLEVETAQLDKVVTLRELEGKTLSPKPLRQDIHYLAELLKRAVGPPIPDPTLLGATQAGLNIAGLEYDLIRTDVEATSRGIQRTVRSACQMGFQATRKGMAALHKDPAWATNDELRLNEVLMTAEAQRDAVMSAAPRANVMQAGVLAAQVAGGVLSLKALIQHGPAVLGRLISWIRGAGTTLTGLEFATLGAGRIGVRVISSAGSLVLTDTEIIALAQAGQLSATATTLYMMANGKPPKLPSPPDFEKWIRGFRTKPTPTHDPADLYEIKHTGPVNIEVHGGGKVVMADGARAADAHLLEAKYVGDPKTSPFLDASNPIRVKIRNDVINEFRRYAAVIKDPSTPAVALEVITNDAEAAGFFRSLMEELEIPGQVVVKD